VPNELGNMTQRYSELAQTCFHCRKGSGLSETLTQGGNAGDTTKLKPSGSFERNAEFGPRTRPNCASHPSITGI
jgi:hypothetical protein